MNTLFIVVLLIEVALGLLLLQLQLKVQSFRFLSKLFFLCVVVVVFWAFFVDSATMISQSVDVVETGGAVGTVGTLKTGSTFQAFSSAFLSLILLFVVVVVQQRFLVLYHALMGGLLSFVVLHVFFEMMLIHPSLLFYGELVDIRSLIIYLIVVDVAYLVGLAAVVGQERMGVFFAVIVQYSVVFSIFLTLALFQRPPDATSYTFLPYENFLALLISWFCGFIFWALFQKKWFLWLPAGLVLVAPLFFVVSA